MERVKVIYVPSPLAHKDAISKGKIVPKITARWSQMTSHRISLKFRSWNILMCLGQLFLFPPRVLSSVYMVNSIETIGRYAASISPVCSAFAYFQATLCYSLWSSVWLEPGGWSLKTFLCQWIHSLPSASQKILLLLIFPVLLLCHIHWRQELYIVIMATACKLLWQVDTVCNERCEMEQIMHLQGPELNCLTISESIVLLF